MQNIIKNKNIGNNKQSGMTFIGLVLVVAALISVLAVGMKVMPAYLEFMSVKKAIKNAANSADTSDKKAVITAFNKSAAVDNVTVIKGADLVVSGGVISTEYQVLIPIVANASVLLDFSATSAK
jgi:Domain of unknown function (DUF4845)